jgi:hypothetical protein
MMKVLAETLLKKSSEPAEAALPRGLGRAELEHLFHDDFVAHAMVIKSRKAARLMNDRMAA